MWIISEWMSYALKIQARYSVWDVITRLEISQNCRCWAPRVLKGGHSKCQQLFGVGPEDSEWGRRTSRFGHLCSQCSSACGSSLHGGHVGSSTGFSKWTYTLRSGVCPGRRWARRPAPTGSRLQPLRGDPNNLLPEGTNATDKASTPKARSPRPARTKDYLCRNSHRHMSILSVRKNS